MMSELNLTHVRFSSVGGVRYRDKIFCKICHEMGFLLIFLGLGSREIVLADSLLLYSLSLTQ
jgi:hypothetical protein